VANYPEPISAQRLIHGFSTDAPAVDPAKLRATRDHMAARGPARTDTDNDTVGR